MLLSTESWPSIPWTLAKQPDVSHIPSLYAIPRWGMDSEETDKCPFMSSEQFSHSLVDKSSSKTDHTEGASHLCCVLFPRVVRSCLRPCTKISLDARFLARWESRHKDAWQSFNISHHSILLSLEKWSNRTIISRRRKIHDVISWMQDVPVGTDNDYNPCDMMCGRFRSDASWYKHNLFRQHQQLPWLEKLMHVQTRR